MTAVRDMGRIIKETAEASDMGAAKLVVFANAVEDNPFMAGAFHGVGEADVVINVGVSGPGVVKRALEKCVARASMWWQKPSKDGLQDYPYRSVGRQYGQRTPGCQVWYRGPVLAPTPAVGDSVARVLEEMGLETVGTHGTTAAWLCSMTQSKRWGHGLQPSRRLVRCLYPCV